MVKLNVVVTVALCLLSLFVLSESYNVESVRLEFPTEQPLHAQKFEDDEIFPMIKPPQPFTLAPHNIPKPICDNNFSEKCKLVLHYTSEVTISSIYITATESVTCEVAPQGHQNLVQTVHVQGGRGTKLFKKDITSKSFTITIHGKGQIYKVVLQAPRVLFSGIGGGMDVINAGAAYFTAKQKWPSAKHIIGTIRTCPTDGFMLPYDDYKLSDHVVLVDKNVIVKDSIRACQNRYIEPFISEGFQAPIFYVARKTTSDEKFNPDHLAKSIQKAAEALGIRHMIFVDGGGDALIMQQLDLVSASENPNPFAGGDAESLQALARIPNTYMGVMVAPLDITKEGLLRNIKMTQDKGGYEGWIDLRNGNSHSVRSERQHLAPLLTKDERYSNKHAMADYHALARTYLAIDGVPDPKKAASFTGIAAFWSLSADCKFCCETYLNNCDEKEPFLAAVPANEEAYYKNTFATWIEKRVVLVRRHHSIMHIFHIPTFEALKCSLPANKEFSSKMAHCKQD